MIFAGRLAVQVSEEDGLDPSAPRKMMCFAGPAVTLPLVLTYAGRGGQIILSEGAWDSVKPVVTQHPGAVTVISLGTHKVCCDDHELGMTSGCSWCLPVMFGPLPVFPAKCLILPCHVCFHAKTSLCTFNALLINHHVLLILLCDLSICFERQTYPSNLCEVLMMQSRWNFSYIFCTCLLVV